MTQTKWGLRIPSESVGVNTEFLDSEKSNHF